MCLYRYMSVYVYITALLTTRQVTEHVCVSSDLGSRWRKCVSLFRTRWLVSSSDTHFTYDRFPNWRFA